jgi:3-oxoacyl-[acyl-carrier-protein] synthase-3
MNSKSGFREKEISYIKILASTKSFLDGGKWVFNEDIHRFIHGKDWKDKMKEINLDPEYYKKEYGFNKRYLVHFPGNSKDKLQLTSADLMEDAGRKAILESGLKKRDISLVIAVSTTSHRYTTSLGAIVAGRLALKCASFEMKAGCSSGIYALVVASQFVNATKGNVLIVSGETLSRVASNQYLYAVGDGGAAVILGYTPNNKSGIKSYYLDSDGSYSDKMGVPGILPPTKEAFEKEEYFFKSTGNLNSVIESKWKEIPKMLYKNANISSSQIKLLIPHQVNNRLMEVCRKAAKISPDRVINKVSEYANCGQVSILIALSDAIQENRIQNGDYFLLCAVGGGLAWGGILWRY